MTMSLSLLMINVTVNDNVAIAVNDNVAVAVNDNVAVAFIDNVADEEGENREVYMR